MKGRILDFSVQNGMGVISGEDGNRYEFAAAEWKEQAMPVRGMVVDFAVMADKAVGVYKALPNAGTSASTPKVVVRVKKGGADGAEKNLLDYIRLCMTQKYADFSGRARRTEMWTFVLAELTVAFVLLFLTVIGAAISKEMGELFLGLQSLVAFALLLPTMAVKVRRLHDIGKSGWWLLIAFIPFGFIGLIVLWCQDSEPDENQYGENPKAVNKLRSC